MRTQRHREAESCQVGEIRDTHEAAAREHHIRAVGIIIKAGSTPTFFPRALSPGLRGSQELVGLCLRNGNGSWTPSWLDWGACSSGADSAKLTPELFLPTPEHPVTFPRMVAGLWLMEGRAGQGDSSVGKGS